MTLTMLQLGLTRPKSAKIGFHIACSLVDCLLPCRAFRCRRCGWENTVINAETRRTRQVENVDVPTPPTQQPVENC